LPRFPKFAMKRQFRFFVAKEGSRADFIIQRLDLSELRF
jgi:hypothetical protein